MYPFALKDLLILISIKWQNRGRIDKIASLTIVDQAEIMKMASVFKINDVLQTKSK